VALLLLAASARAVPPARQEITLNGAWEVQFVTDLTNAPAANDWNACNVPGPLEGTDNKRAWLRRSFTVPGSMRGARLKIFFGGVKYNSRILINGQHVGGCFGGYEPFEVDVTDAVRFDATNLLMVGVHDWTGVFSPGRVEFKSDDEWFGIRARPQDRILSPIGGHFGVFGIWDEVLLRAVPAVYIQDLFIRSSVSSNRLAVDYTLANESKTDAEVVLQTAVEDSGKDVLQLPVARVTVPAGRTITMTLAQAWPAPHLWSYADPYLYHLRSELSTGDRLLTRFGFREFRVKGADFYLNGIKVNLLATSAWPPKEPASREQIDTQWRGVKSFGAYAFRTHTQPWPAAWYDAADEIGLLVTIEGAVWNDDDTYRINDPVFWDNYARHLQSMVRRHKNHPSVIMWSLENEFFGGKLNDKSPAKADLIRMGRLMKTWDPTRPITYESDGDPGGVADVIGLHYPHEYPEYTCWPNEAFWLDKPQDIHELFLNGESQFLWRKDKPLYIGEFLWAPAPDPAANTIFFGDESYRDYQRYRILGKAECWSMAILGYRHFGVNGICPWTVMEGGPLNASNELYNVSRYRYQPVAAFCLNYDGRFFSKEIVSRNVEVFNDCLETSDLTLAWTLQSADSNVVDRGSTKLQLAPAEHRQVAVELHMPAVKETSPLRWNLTLDRAGQTVFKDSYSCKVYPRPETPAVNTRIAVYDTEDGKGVTRKLLGKYGWPSGSVRALDQPGTNLDILVIGAGSLRSLTNTVDKVIGRVVPERAALDAFLARGGKVLVLEQEVYPEGLFDLTLTTHRSTMTFPLTGNHPALRHLEADDLRYWRGDHMVTLGEPARPARGGGRSIIVSGSAGGIDFAPLQEWAVGRGCIMFCQLQLIAKLESEPAAAILLNNLLEYLATYRSAVRPTLLAGGTPEYAARLAELGLRFQMLAPTVRAEPPAGALLVCRGDLTGGPNLRSFVEQGGNLYLSRLTAAGLATVARDFNVDLELQPYRGPVGRAGNAGPLSGSIAREDLYWLGKHHGTQWDETPRAMDVTDGVFGRRLPSKGVTTNDLAGWTLDGKYVKWTGKEVTFATVGSASSVLDLPEDGDYLFGLVARGTPCRGEDPVATLSVDGQSLGSVSVTNGPARPYTLFAALRGGRHAVAIAFVNDAYDPATKEDRNLHVERLLVARLPADPAREILTMPPTTVALKCGKGRLVIDQLRWDTTDDSRRMAGRYIAGLLGELGGDFAIRPGVVLECEAMAPAQTNTLVSTSGTFAGLFSNNALVSPLEVAVTTNYAVEVVARGTPAKGGYPTVGMMIDGKPVGGIELTGNQWRAYPLRLSLSAGKHVMKLAYTNDAYEPGVADRNLFLDKVVFYRE